MAVRPEVSGYRIIGEVGRGGFAVVYRAEQLSLHREVALKVLSVLDMTEDEVTRFARECDTLAQLDWHPNILRILDAGMTDEGRPYLSMELLENGSIGSKFLGTPMPMDDVIELGTQISGALAAAHAAGVLHRDVKPANILIDRTNRYRLADFGIASIVGSSRSSSTGMAGTVGYLAPEIILGKKATPQSDIYSLAATLHALVTGTPPFSKATDESAAASIARTLHEAAADLRELGAPEWFAAAIERALAKDPAVRFGSADEFAATLLARGDQTLIRSVPSVAGPSPDATVRHAKTEQMPAIVTAVMASDGHGGMDDQTVRRMPPGDTGRFDSPTIVRASAPPPLPPLVVAGVTPAGAPKGPDRRRLDWRAPAIAMAVVTLFGGTAIGLYSATKGSDSTAPPGTTAAPTDEARTSAPSSTEVTIATDAASSVATSDSAASVDTTVGSSGSTIPIDVPAPGPSLPTRPATTVAGSPRPVASTTTAVASFPAPGTPATPAPVTTSSATVSTGTTATTPPAAPTTTARPVVTTTTAPATTTTVPPAPLTLSAVSQSASEVPGQYLLSSTVSDRCVSIVWSIPGIGRGQSTNNGGACWGTNTMQFNTAWFGNESNVPPTGSYAGTLTATNRAGVSTTRNFTLNVP